MIINENLLGPFQHDNKFKVGDTMLFIFLPTDPPSFKSLKAQIYDMTIIEKRDLLKAKIVSKLKERGLDYTGKVKRLKEHCKAADPPI